MVKQIKIIRRMIRKILIMKIKKMITVSISHAMQLLTDALTNEKKITELKEKEISETKVKLYELESKNDSMKRKNKEKENLTIFLAKKMMLIICLIF